MKSHDHWLSEGGFTFPKIKVNPKGKHPASKCQHAGTLKDGPKDGHKPGKKKWRNPARMTEQEKSDELEMIRNRMNRLQQKIEANEGKVGKILHKSLEHARRIGTLLKRVKRLLPHGEYQDWIENWFDGSPATARAYKQIAEGWNYIGVRKGKVMDISIREALQHLQDKPPVMAEFRHDYQTLMGQFERMIAEWPGYVCESAAKDEDSMEDLKRTLKTIFKRHGGTPPKDLMREFEIEETPVNPRLVTLPDGRKRLWYGWWTNLLDSRFLA